MTVLLLDLEVWFLSALTITVHALENLDKKGLNSN